MTDPGYSAGVTTGGMTGAMTAATGAMTAATGAMTGAMTAATGAMTAATGVPDRGCCGDSSTPRRERSPPSQGRVGSDRAHELRASGAI